MYYIYKLQKNNFFNILLCLLLIFSFVLTSYTTASAGLPILLGVVGTASLAALLYSVGYASLTVEDVTNAYSSMTTELKEMIDGLSWRSASTNMGLMSAFISQTLSQKFLEWFNGNENNTLPGGYVDYSAYILATPNSGKLEVLTDIASDNAYEYQLFVGSQYSLYRYYLYESNTPFKAYIQSNGNIVIAREPGSTFYESSSKWDGYKYIAEETRKEIISQNYTVRVIRTTSNTMDYHMLGYNSNVPVYNNYIYTQLLGYLPNISPTYTYNDQYNGTLPPVITAPLNNAPDTTVNPAQNNSVDLNTIIDGYGSLEAFFAAGGSLVLSDGTVVQGVTGVNDLTRATEAQVSEVAIDVATDTPWEYKIPILGDILKWLIRVAAGIQALASAETTRTLDFTPLKIGLTEVFPFCIPFDLLRMVTVYSATPDDFVFKIDLETDYFIIDHEVDLTPFRIPIIFFRWVVTIWFSWILISRTRDMIKW